ncbi:hypothetical protein [Moraxella lacunata]|uniref:hypothetical protein n=1 Tax=Moraxella lacunata TaxID=477 RepID=UPI003EE215FC
MRWRLPQDLPIKYQWRLTNPHLINLARLPSLTTNITKLYLPLTLLFMPIMPSTPLNKTAPKQPTLPKIWQTLQMAYG